MVGDEKDYILTILILHMNQSSNESLTILSVIGQVRNMCPMNFDLINLKFNSEQTDHTAFF